MRLAYNIIIILLIISFTGCIETKVRGYTDTEFATYKINSIAILAISDDIGLTEAIENSLIENLSSKGITALRSTDILPPTRTYNEDEIKKAFSSRGIHSLMIINVGESAQSSQVVGYQSFGHAYGSTSGSVYGVGNTAYVNMSGSATGTSTSVAIRKFKRNTVTRSTLYDISSTNIVWTGQTETEAGGSLYTSDNSTGGSLSGTIVDELIKRGHIPLNNKNQS